MSAVFKLLPADLFILKGYLHSLLTNFLIAKATANVIS